MSLSHVRNDAIFHLFKQFDTTEYDNREKREAWPSTLCNCLITCSLLIAKAYSVKHTRCTVIISSCNAQWERMREASLFFSSWPTWAGQLLPGRVDLTAKRHLASVPRNLFFIRTHGAHARQRTFLAECQRGADDIVLLIKTDRRPRNEAQFRRGPRAPKK